MPSAAARVSINGGANKTIADKPIQAPSAATIQFSSADTSFWTQQRWELYAYPDGFTAPAGWSTDANGVIYSTAVTPSSFTLAANTVRWGKWGLRLTVNNGLVNGVADSSMVDESLAFEMLSPGGLTDLMDLESNQFEKDWVKPHQANLRVIEAGLGAGGGTSIAGTTTLEEHGAIGDGVTNDSAAFTAALATGKTILLGAKTYLVSTGGSLQAGAAIVGVGDLSVLKTTGTTSVILIDGDGCVLKDFKILGVSAGSDTQIGIQNGLAGAGTGFMDLRITGVHCVDLGGHGFMMQSTDGGADDIGPSLADCCAEGCGSNVGTPGAGFYIAAEYTVLTGCRAIYNSGYANGLQINAGNVVWNGGQITQNGVGIKINSGPNDSHGIVSGCQINHNSTGISVDDIANGHTFIGCHIYSNQIYLIGSNGVRFVGCTIGTDIAFQASQNTVFSHCCFPTGSSVNLYQNYTGASTEEFVGCYDLTGAPFAAATASTDTNLVKNFWASRITLTPTNASYTEKVENLVARRIRYDSGGGIAGPITITYPTPVAARDYYEKTIHNTTGFTLTFKISGGAGIAVATGKTAILGFDVVSEYRVTADV